MAEIKEEIRKVLERYGRGDGEVYIIPKSKLPTVIKKLEKIVPEFKYTLPRCDGSYVTKYFVYYPPNAKHPRHGFFYL